MCVCVFWGCLNVDDDKIELAICLQIGGACLLAVIWTGLGCPVFSVSGLVQETQAAVVAMVSL